MKKRTWLKNLHSFFLFLTLRLLSLLLLLVAIQLELDSFELVFFLLDFSENILKVTVCNTICVRAPQFRFWLIKKN